MKKIINKILSLFPVIAFTLIFLAVIVTNIVKLNYDEVIVNVQQKVPKGAEEIFPVLKNYTDVNIKGEDILALKDNHLFLKFIAPKNELIIDNLYAFGLLICGLIIIYSFWNYNKEKPFAGKLSICIDNVGTILLLLWLVNCLRTFLFNKEVLSLTNHEYMYELPPFEKPEFWVAILLLRLAYVMKKGENLQQEQDLTV